MNERKLIREFLDKANAGVCLACGQNPCKCIELCGACHCDPCKCPGHSDKECNDYTQDYSLDSMEHGEAHHEMEFDINGNISPEELHHHFDLNDDGVVTPQEYVDHIQYHVAHPETLDHYNQLRDQSYQTVPCKDSYDMCSQHLMGTPDDINKFLKPLMDCTGSTCKESSIKAMLDVLQSLVSCGIVR
jgi:hypothetical protein